MAADDCIPQLFVCALRVGTILADGTPTGTPYVTDALAKATLTPVYDEGDEVKVKNGCGRTFIDVLADPTFVRCDLELDLLTPDPDLHDILISQGTLLSANGGVGFAYPPIGAITGNGVSIEMWAQRMIDGGLSDVNAYALWALPRVKNLRLGPRDFSNSEQHSIITGQCLESANFGDGPAADFDAASDRVAQWIPINTIPTPTCSGASS